jgi:hypothetical protein
MWNAKYDVTAVDYVKWGRGDEEERMRRSILSSTSFCKEAQAKFVDQGWFVLLVGGV